MTALETIDRSRVGDERDVLLSARHDSELVLRRIRAASGAYELDDLAALVRFFGVVRIAAQRSGIAELVCLADAAGAVLDRLELGAARIPDATVEALGEAIAGSYDGLAGPRSSHFTERTVELVTRLEQNVPEAPSDLEALELFAADAARYIEGSCIALHAIKKDPTGSSEHVHAAFRAMHTLKGGSAMMGFAAMEVLARTAEQVLETLRANEIVATEELVDAVLALMEKAGEGLDDPAGFEWQDASSVLARAVEQAREVAGRTRLGDLLLERNLVDRDQLELALAIRREPLGEALVRLEVLSPSDLERTLDVQRRLRAGEQVAVESADAQRSMTLAIDVRKLCAVGEQVHALRRTFTEFRREMERDGSAELDALSALAARVEELGACIVSLERIPLASAFRKAVRTSRDLARRLGKTLRVSVSGDEIEAYRPAVEQLADALLHVVRNAVDHGLETKDERAESGKDPCGQISIAARLAGDELVVEIEDDGRGLARDRILARAIERGLLPAGQVHSPHHHALRRRSRRGARLRPRAREARFDSGALPAATLSPGPGRVPDGSRSRRQP
jgi:chemotaxis protein histidine kinase CheA